MAIHVHRAKQMVLRARAGQDVVRGKSVHAAIGVRQCSASLAMHHGMTRQSHTTCSRLLSGKMLDVAEVLARGGVPLEVHVRVTLVAVAAMVVGKASRAAAIVPPGQTTRQEALSRTR